MVAFSKEAVAGLAMCAVATAQSDLVKQIDIDKTTHTYAESYNGTVDHGLAVDMASALNDNLPFTIINPSAKSMCLVGHRNDFIANKMHFVSPTPEKLHSGLFMAPNSSVLLHNFMPDGEAHVNGRFQAFFDCNSDCSKCPGSDIPRHTLFEYTYVNNPTTGNKPVLVWNLSNVDGFSNNANVTVYNAKGEHCHKPRVCDASAASVITKCPANRLWTVGNSTGCESECRATGSSQHCCTGEFSAHGSCPDSSHYLRDICKDAYMFPHDDQKSVDTCHYPSGVRMSFWPTI